MLELFLHNPGLSHLAIQIFKNLDIKSLAKCREVSGICKYLIDHNVKFWRRLLNHRLKTCLWLSNLLNSRCECGNNYDQIFAHILTSGGDEDWQNCANFLANPNEEIVCPLLLAVTSNDKYMVELFMESKLIPVKNPIYRHLFGRDRPITTPLHSAVLNIDILEIMLEHCSVDDVLKEDRNGRTALHIAAKIGSLKAVESLLSATNFANPCDEEDITPLHLASSCGFFDIVEFLCDNYANLACQDATGSTPLHKAVFRGHAPIVELLMVKLHEKDIVLDVFQPGFTPLHIASVMGRIDLINIICPYLKDFNIKDSGSGRTPLHEAVIQGHFQAVKVLLSYIQDETNPKDEFGITPLHYAAKQGLLLIVQELLLKLGHLSTCPKDNYGSTPIHNAAENGHLEVVKVLAEHFRHDLNPKDNKNLTPLDIAVKHRNDNVACFLKDKLSMQ